MKHLILFTIIFSCSLTATRRKSIRRTYSIHPLVEKLKHSLMMQSNDLEVDLDNGLPYTLDRQYSLLGLTMQTTTRNQLLKAIEEYWVTSITEDPDHISSLLFDLNTLDVSYGLATLDCTFKRMLTRLKQRLLVALQNTTYKEQLDEIPSYTTLPRLQSFALHVIARNRLEVDEVLINFEEIVVPRIYVTPPLIEVVES